METRKDELAALQSELAIFAMSLTVMVVSPGIAAAATFATYVLIDENNILTASKTFSVLLLFGALRFPINFAGRLVGKASQAYSAAQRIAAFLELEIREPEDLSTVTIPESVEADPIILRLVKAAFRIGAIEKLSSVHGGYT